MKEQQKYKHVTQLSRCLILHDLTEQEAKLYLPENGSNITLFSALPPVKNCIGCFCCWVKTPGVCVIDDRIRLIREIYPKQESLIIVSRCVYGGVSPDVKAVLDRNIGISLPFFRVVDGEMHHYPRYKPLSNLIYHFYGVDISQREKETAYALAAANARNLYAKESKVLFHETLSGIKEAL